MRLFVVLLIGFTLNSCSYGPQVIRLDPARPVVNTAAAASSSGAEILLVTHDARTVQEIGRRLSGLQNEAAITTDTDIPALLEARMAEILKAKGYRVVQAGLSNVPRFDLQLKELTYRPLDEAGQHKVKIQ